jgi:DNA polymerase III subunit epsilon
MFSESLVVLDFETTGLHPDQGDRITEVAAVRLYDGVIVDRYESLINCGRRQSNSIRQFTGINQQMIDSAPTSSRVLPGLLFFIGNDPVVSHNAAFDQGFLDCECERLDLRRLGDDFICTVQLARRLLPALPSHSLHALVRHFNLSNIGEHRAALDVEATVQVLLQLCGLAKNLTRSAEITASTLRLLATGPLPDWHIEDPDSASALSA